MQRVGGRETIESSRCVLGEWHMSDDQSYFAARAAQERRLAMASADLNVRRIHLEMAAKYLALAAANGADLTNIVGETGQQTA